MGHVIIGHMVRWNLIGKCRNDFVHGKYLYGTYLGVNYRFFF